MRNNKNTPKIILALVVAVLATMISYSVFSNLRRQVNEKDRLLEVMQKTQAENRVETYAYAVAKTDLKAGQMVADEDVDFKNFSIMDPNAFDNRADVVNKILLKDILSGEEFTTAHIAKISNDDVTLREGYRALTLPADNFQGKADTMVPGTSIDIYSASADNNWVMENVKIMSFEGAKGTGEASTSTSTMTSPSASTTIQSATAITFEVPVDCVTDFISNASKGKLVLVARGANDKKIYHKRKPHYSSDGDYSASSYPALPSLPKTPQIKNLSGLPDPIQPVVQSPSVEVIEANVKSKVTFDNGSTN